MSIRVNIATKSVLLLNVSKDEFRGQVFIFGQTTGCRGPIRLPEIQYPVFGI